MPTIACSCSITGLLGAPETKHNNQSTASTASTASTTTNNSSRQRTDGHIGCRPPTTRWQHPRTRTSSSTMTGGRMCSSTSSTSPELTHKQTDKHNKCSRKEPRLLLFPGYFGQTSHKKDTVYAVVIKYACSRSQHGHTSDIIDQSRLIIECEDLSTFVSSDRTYHVQTQ